MNTQPMQRAGVDELGLARKRIEELEGQLRTRRGAGFRLTQLLGHVAVLAVIAVIVVSALATLHRLVLWGWP